MALEKEENREAEAGKKERTPYLKPVVRDYGSVVKLTATGSGGPGDVMSTEGLA